MIYISNYDTIKELAQYLKRLPDMDLPKSTIFSFRKPTSLDLFQKETLWIERKQNYDPIEVYIQSSDNSLFPLWEIFTDKTILHELREEIKLAGEKITISVFFV